jgi:putative peptidoglycan lipid II flippase
LILTVLVEIFMPQFMMVFAAGFMEDEKKFASVVLLTKITFPYLIFISLVALMSGILNTYGKFFAVSLVPLVMNISLILFIYWSKSLSRFYIITFLSAGVLFSGLFQFIFIAYFVIREKIYLFPVRPHFSHKTREFFGKFWQTFLASGVVQINSLISSIIATLIPGAVSLLYYGDRITQFPLSLIGTAISVTVLPSLSKTLGKNGDRDEAQALQEGSFFLSFFLGLPSAVGLFTLGGLMVEVLLERGEFTSMDTSNVATIIEIYSIALPFFIISKILNAIFYAKKDTRTPMLNSVLNLVLNVVGALVLSRFWGVNGIAVATVISIVISVSVLARILVKERIFVFSESIKLKILKIVYASLVMGICIVCFRNGLQNVGIPQALKLIITGGISGFLYLFLAQAMGIVNLMDLRELIRK